MPNAWIEHVRKYAPDTGNNIQRYYRQIPFDDLRFYEF